jgi:hypothetical protein
MNMLKNEIPHEMIDGFNEWMSMCDSNVRLKSRLNDGGITIVYDFVIEDVYVKEITLEDFFYDELENFFAGYGIKLIYNNTKSCFWKNTLR